MEISGSRAASSAVEFVLRSNCGLCSADAGVGLHRACHGACGMPQQPAAGNQSLLLASCGAFSVSRDRRSSPAAGDLPVVRSSGERLRPL